MPGATPAAWPWDKKRESKTHGLTWFPLLGLEGISQEDAGLRLGCCSTYHMVWMETGLKIRLRPPDVTLKPLQETQGPNTRLSENLLICQVGGG